jgi:hypothetical protein
MHSIGGAVVAGFLVLFLTAGCYTTSLMEVTGSDGVQAFTGVKEIKGVVTKEGARFDTETAYVRAAGDMGDTPSGSAAVDSLIGYADGERIAVPLAMIEGVMVSTFDPTVTVIAVVGGAATVGGIIAVIKSISENWPRVKCDFELASPLNIH